MDPLEALLKQKAELNRRDDLTPEEKQHLGRTLRRKIRQLGGTCRVLNEGASSDTPRAPRSATRSNRGSAKGISRVQTKEFTDYVESLLATLAEKGLEWKTVGELLDITAYGYSLLASWEANITADELIEKFRHRWASASPKWFAVGDENSRTDYILMGPLPVSMTIS